MPTAVKLSDKIVAGARIMSQAVNRSVAGQIEFWAKIGKAAEENPDLNYQQILDLIIEEQKVQN